LDADDAGRAGAAKIQQHLGIRTKIVELPVPDGEESTDISEYFQRDGHTTEDFDALIESFRGRRLFTIGDAMAERDIMLTASGMALGWKALDHWIHPGILPGQVMVVLAKTGVGKTAWLTQVLHNLSEHYTYDGHYKDKSGEIDEHHRPGGPAEPVLVLSLEQTKGELVDRMQKIARFYDPRLPDELFRQAYRNVRLNDENKIPPADMRPLVAEFIEDVEMPPKLIVLDYLGYWARSFKGKSRYEQVSDAIMELKSIAKEYGVSIVVPHQVSRSGRKGERLELDFARDSGVVEETADFALALYAPHTKEDREDATTSIDSRSDVRLEILKSRHGGVGREQRMSWAPASLALPETGDPYIRRLIEFEYQWMDEGLLYTDILAKLKGTKI
ncbi:AAA family ATPase, partial [Candidatus Bipolaricaulota bacterium]|nr:AAA family ATPase [Candidatus Bipolaricaulota bacterium]